DRMPPFLAGSSGTWRESPLLHKAAENVNGAYAAARWARAAAEAARQDAGVAEKAHGKTPATRSHEHGGPLAAGSRSPRTITGVPVFA
ncbi:hypothetical protein AB0B21_11480, partial [Streptomyces rimosus]|uniref:hypothetical protein n=1 Tax=Streptomyces rimosus TaxID=1927 RepID=UPI0033FAF4BA